MFAAVLALAPMAARADAAGHQALGVAVSATAAAAANDTDGLASVGRLAGLNSNVVYAAGTTTASSNAYKAPAGKQPLPATLAAGQVYFVNFNAANTGAATLQVGTLAAKPLKVLNSAGTALTMIGGEVVAGPATVYYDGTQFIYRAPGSQVVAVAGAKTLTQANFSSHDTFYLTAGAQTVTLPCSSTLSPNGQVFLFSVNGIATIAAGGGCTGDTITKNGSAGASTTVAQGAAAATIATDGAGHFYVSGS